MKKIEFFVSDDNLLFEKEEDCITHEKKFEKEEKPYIYKFKLDLKSMVSGEYNPKYGDNRKCSCGHVYYRHFDSYEEMSACGCKYCECGEFKEEDLSYKVKEEESLTDDLISYLEIEDKMYEKVRENQIQFEYYEDFKSRFKEFCKALVSSTVLFKVNKNKTQFHNYKKEDWIEKYKKDYSSEIDKEYLEEAISKIESGEEVVVYMELSSDLSIVKLKYDLDGLSKNKELDKTWYYSF